MSSMILRLLVLPIALINLSGCENQASTITQTTSEAVYIEANGELASRETAVISPPAVEFQWQYKIAFVMPEGSHVVEGQPLINFDASQLSQKLAVKKSELKTSKKSLENIHLTTRADREQQKLDLAKSRMEMDKAKRKWMQSKGLEGEIQIERLAIEAKISENEVQRRQQILQKTVESSKVKIAIEEAHVKRIEVEVSRLEQGISRMSIKAPKSGIVIYRADGGGDKITNGDTVWRGRQLIELPSLDKMIVKAQVLEADAGKVKVGQRVEVVLDAVPERIFSGKISQLGKIFRPKSREQANVIFDADILLDESDDELMRPGMAARVKIFR